MEVKQIKGQRNIPDIIRGDAEALGTYIQRLDEHISKLEWQSDGHRMWYTHKNPYSCWICELLQVNRILRDELVAEGDNDGDGTGTDELSEDE